MSSSALRELQATKLRAVLRLAREGSSFWRARLDAAGFDPRLLVVELRDLGPDPLARLLAELPLLEKSELQDDQQRHPPYGSGLTAPRERYARLHRTSGTTGGKPLVWLDTAESWEWFLHCWRSVYRGAGLGSRERYFFPFSFGPFIGFWAAFEAAARAGWFALPGGSLSSAARLHAVLEHEITVVTSTPTYALHLVEVAEREGLDLPGSAVRALVVAGEPGGSIPATRARIEAGWGARVFDHCGMTEMGAYGFEALDDPGHLRVIESEFVVEVLDPESREAVPAGEEGELVLTNLGRAGSPAIRYATGDLVRYEPAPNPELDDPSTHGRLLGGLLGRVDDMVFVRGNNVYPGAVEAVLRRFREVAEYRVLVIESPGLTDFRIEVEPIPSLGVSEREALTAPLVEAVRERLNFRPALRWVSPGSLPRFELKARRLVRLREGALPTGPQGTRGSDDPQGGSPRRELRKEPREEPGREGGTRDAAPDQHDRS